MPIRLATSPPESYRFPLLIRHLLHRPMRAARHQEIVYRDRRRHSYEEFGRRIERLARALTDLGVEPGTTVSVLDWDSHRYLECFFAVPMLGAVLQTVNVRLSPQQIAWTMAHAGTEVALVHRDFEALFLGVRGHLKRLKRVVLIDDEDTSALPDWADSEYERMLAMTAEGFRFEDFDENAIATTFYTTGTTGEPKGVCFSHRQLVLHTLALASAVAAPAFGQSFRHDDVYMPMTPMFHVHAWGNPYVATLLGVKQVYPGKYAASELLEWRSREGVSFSHCVPTILRMLLDAAVAQGVSVRGWKICIGGSALPAGLVREALDLGIDLFAGYGMSETGPVLTVTRLTAAAEIPAPDAEIERRSRAGTPIPLVDLRIIDSQGAVLADGDPGSGEIVVRAPWTTPAYVGNPEASLALWRGGYLHTQDVGRMDGEGFLSITDRVKDVIKTGGEWLSSIELEDLISELPAVAEVAVIGVPDECWGERPLALIVARAGASLDPDTIRAHVARAAASGRVPRYAVPERVIIVDALDRTSVGKIDKRALRSRWADFKQP